MPPTLPENNIMDMDDFTFPTTTTTGSPPRFIESPPLWRPPEKPPRKQETKPDSFQEFMKTGDEEKMDALWENLNDEGSMGCDQACSPGRGVQVSCVQSLKLSRANGNVFSGKKPIILMLINVVKKVLLMQNSHRGIKK